jgi:hypothetical protein
MWFMNVAWLRGALVALVAFGSAGVTWAVARTSGEESYAACVKKNGEVRMTIPGFSQSECDKEGKVVHLSAPGRNFAVRVVDGQNRDMGRLLSVQQPVSQATGGVSDDWTIESYNEELNLVVILSSRGSVGSLTPLGFSGENCTGTAFSSDPVAPVLFGTFENGAITAPYFRPVPGSLASRDGVSMRAVTGECLNQAFSGNGYAMEEVALPFVPVAPFELGE